MVLGVGDELPGLGYQLAEEIARGGHAVIYRAIHPVLSPKAVKVLLDNQPPEIVEGLVREGIILDSLDHPNIIRFNHLLHLPTGEVAIVMQLADGGSSLRDELDAKTLSIDDAYEVARVLCSALYHCHRSNILHLDVTPNNLLRIGKRWVLVDFGIADFIDSPRLTSRRAMGTPAYVAPDILRHTPTLLSDLFAAASVIFETLCSETIYTGSDPQSVVSALLDPAPVRRLPSNPEIPEEVRDVLACALDKDPRWRYPSMLQFWRALQRAFEGRAVQPKAAASRPRQINTALLREIKVQGKPRSLSFSYNGQILSWIAGRLISAYDTLSEARLYSQRAPGINTEGTLLQAEFVGADRVWCIKDQKIHQVVLDQFVHGRGSDVLNSTPMVITSEPVGCFARSAREIAIASSTSSKIWIYALTGSSIGELEATFDDTSDWRVTHMGWCNNDLVITMSRRLETSIFVWRDANFADLNPVVTAILNRAAASAFDKDFVPFTKVAVNPMNRIAVMSAAEVILLDAAIISIRPPSGTVSDICWLGSYLAIGYTTKDNQKIGLYDKGKLIAEVSLGTASRQSPGIYLASNGNLLACSYMGGIQFYQVQ